MAAFTASLGEMFRGDNREITVAVVDADGTTPLDITGWTLWFTGKLEILDLDGAAIFMKTTSDGITITDAAGGEATIALVPADTDALTELSTTLYCDLQGKDGSGKVRTLATYTLDVLAEITRETTI